MLLNLFRIAYPVTSLGPGSRVVIWVAGCRKRCKGCISPEMQDPAAGQLIDTAVLANHLFKLAHPIDGITISGGEPFDQAEALAELLEMVKLFRPEWNVLVYTGYVMKTVRRKEECCSLLEKVDVLIDGPYRQEIPQKHPLAGSRNQSVICLNVNIKHNHTIANFNTSNRVTGLGRNFENIIIGIQDF